MSQFNTQEGCRVGRHRSCQGRAETGEEGPVATFAVELAHDTADGDVALGGLQTRLDGVDGEDGNPHGHTGGSACARHSREAQLPRGLARGRINGRHGPLDVLVCGKVGGGAGAVARKRGSAAAEDAADAALAVQLAHDVEASAVLGLLAGLELLLALDLQDDLDALKGGGDGRHGDGGEEAGSRDLRNGQAVGGDGGNIPDELFAKIVTPE